MIHCNHCNTDKEESEFYKRADGFIMKPCKTCWIKRARKYNIAEECSEVSECIKVIMDLRKESRPGRLYKWAREGRISKRDFRIILREINKTEFKALMREI